MCFSFEVSIVTFLNSWLIGLYLLTKRKLTVLRRHNVIFLLIFSSMQIADAILWYIKMKKNKINYLVSSILIPTLLSLQVIYNVYFINKGKNKYLNIMSVIVIIYIFIKFHGYSSPLCNKYGSPVWGSNEITFKEILIFSILIFYPQWKPILITICVFIPLIYIFVKGSYGSMWCFVSNIIAFYYLYAS